ncbi:MFS transporter [Halobacillus sp. KGW1]|uniref:MFS transporter n=1 Tax=Halobacillus sp. KGW1 TaxID=1793726 RepID=UPI0007857306|nr:MFS transporter [Halobacillus sp. KGW1]
MGVAIEPTHPYTPRESGFWRITAALMIASLSTFSTLYVFQPLLPLLSDSYDRSATVSSFVMSSCVLAMVVGLFVLGFLSDRYGRVAVMKLSLFVTVITLSLIPLVDSFEWIVALRVIQGFFLAGIPAAAMGYLGEETSPKHIGLAMTLYISSNALGGMGGRVGAGYLAGVFDLRLTIWVFAFFGVLAAFLFLVLIPNERFFEKTDQSIVKDLQGLFVHLRSGNMLFLFLMGFLLQAVFTAVWTYLPFYLQGEPFRWTLEVISFTYFAYLFGIIAPPLAGRMSLSLGMKRVMYLAVLVMLAGAGVTAVPSGSMIVFGLCLLCMGFFVAHAMASALVSKSATHHRSGASGFYLISYYAGVAVGSTAAGVLWEGSGWLGILSIGISFLVLFFCMWLFRRRGLST